METNSENFPLEMRGYTLTELAASYGICVRTLKNWLAPFESSIGKKNGRFYTVAQVRIILEKLGAPDYKPTRKGID